MKSILVLITSVTFAISPFLSPEFGGFDPDKYPVPQIDPAIQPAGYAFSIWGLIYIALIGHAIYGVLQRRDDVVWDRSRTALFISLAIGSIWLPVALASPIWATVLIWLMLVSALVALYRLIGGGPSAVAFFPVALYAGWLSAASFVSIGLLLAGYGVMGEVSAAILALLLATGFAVANAYRLRSYAYAGAVVWGLLGIIVANLGGATVVAALAAVAALLIVGVTVWRSSSAVQP